MRVIAMFVALAAATNCAVPAEAAQERLIVKYGAASFDVGAAPAAGKDLRPGEHLVAVFESGAVAFHSSSAAFSIPANAVTRIGYLSHSRRRSEIVVAGWTSFLISALRIEPVRSYPNAFQEAAFLTLLPVGFPAGALHPFKRTRHFVEITWSEDGEPRAVRLEIGKRQQAAFLARMKAMTGQVIENWPKAAR